LRRVGMAMFQDNEKERNEKLTGFCACGCGKKTSVALWTDRRQKWIKGESKRFIHGHNSKNVKGPNHHNWKGGRTINGEYIECKNEKHPRADSRGYVLEHILIAEKVLGKFLPLKVVVHHVNNNSSDNRNQNLLLCENNAYHLLLHRRKRAYDASGKSWWRKCRFCKNHDDPKNMIIEKNGAIHKECQKIRSHNKYLKSALPK